MVQLDLEKGAQRGLRQEEARGHGVGGEDVRRTPRGAKSGDGELYLLFQMQWGGIGCGESQGPCVDAANLSQDLYARTLGHGMV